MKKVWLTTKKWYDMFNYVPRPAINILIKTSKGVVLSKRAVPPHKGYWHAPGSFLLKGETFEEACKRVGKTELGVKIKILKFLSVDESFKDSRGHVVDINFLCRKIGGKFKPDKNTLEIGVFKNLPRLIFPQHDRYFKEALRWKKGKG